MRFIIIIGLTILLTSCASSMNNYYPQTVQSWHGGSVNQLVQRWGRPDRVTTSPNGNRYYVYQTESYRSNASSSNPMLGMHVSAQGRPTMTSGNVTNPSLNSTLSLSCSTVFEANASGQIVNTHVTGGGCYGSSGFSNRMSNPGGH